MDVCAAGIFTRAGKCGAGGPGSGGPVVGSEAPGTRPWQLTCVKAESTALAPSPRHPRASHLHAGLCPGHGHGTRRTARHGHRVTRVRTRTFPGGPTTSSLCTFLGLVSSSSTHCCPWSHPMLLSPGPRAAAQPPLSPRAWTLRSVQNVPELARSDATTYWFSFDGRCCALPSISRLGTCEVTPL